MAKRIKGLREFERDLNALLSTKTIHKHLAEHHGETVLDAVIGAAESGIGPGDKPYPAYSPEYDKLKAKKGGGMWLRGIGRTGKRGGMLDRKHFKYEVEADGSAALVWTAPDERMGIYAEVHQEGLPLGRGGPKKKRKWLHFEGRTSATALDQAYQATLDELAAQFNAGRTPK